MDKEDVAYYTQWNISHKKNEILPYATACMDLQGIMLSEISQRKSNTEHFHLYVGPKKQTKKYNKTEKNRNRLTDTENKLVAARREECAGMGKIGEGD